MNKKYDDNYLNEREKGYLKIQPHLDVFRKKIGEMANTSEYHSHGDLVDIFGGRTYLVEFINLAVSGHVVFSRLAKDRKERNKPHIHIEVDQLGNVNLSGERGQFSINDMDGLLEQAFIELIKCDDVATRDWLDLAVKN